jgi:putative membrane protein
MIAIILTLLVAAIHVYILIVEMFLWETPRARAAFGTTVEFAKASKVLAANQGLYNGFLAAGLLWSLWMGEAGRATVMFFLGCVIVAGLYGAATANRRILLVQVLPAGLAILAWVIWKP